MIGCRGPAPVDKLDGCATYKAPSQMTELKDAIAILIIFQFAENT